MPSANVIVVNDQGEILMIRRTDNGNWAVPGGAMDLGESITDAAVRETREETGIDCEITGLVGIYTNPRHVIRYTSNEEVRQEFSIVFTARPTGGELTAKQRVIRAALDRTDDSHEPADAPIDAAAHPALPRPNGRSPTSAEPPSSSSTRAGRRQNLRGGQLDEPRHLMIRAIPPRISTSRSAGRT